MVGFYNESKVKLRDSIFLKNNFSHVHNIFLNSIGKIQKGGNILDIGTGNGYVLSEVEKKYPNCYSLFGVDISQDMLMSAKNTTGGNIHLLLADNNNLPFRDDYFSSVVAKNVTNFSANELTRILQDEGVFVFREYGQGRGLVEIANLFKNRIINPRDFGYYADTLDEAGFYDIQVQQFNITRKYLLEELTSIMGAFPFVKDLSVLDFKKVEREFDGEREIKITSDPFVLIARSRKNG